MKNTTCLRISIIGMVVTGVWLPKSLEDSKWKAYYYGYAIAFQIVLFLPLIYVQTVHLFLVMGDISKTVEVSVLLLTHFAQVAKIVNIWFRQDRIKYLFEILESPLFNRTEPEKKAILEKAVNNISRVSKLLVTSSIVTAGLWGVYPLLRPTLQLPLGYPYLEANTTFFGVWYVQQAAGIFLCAVGDQTEDLLAGGLMLLAAVQLDLLHYELTIIESSDSDGSSNDCQEVIACIKYHQKIIEYVKELDKIFGAAVLCQFAMSCLIVCMTALKITIITEPTEIITMIFYLLCILAELMVYCYPGDVIKLKELSQEKRERRTTGGGPPPPKPSDTSEWICSIMSESIVGLPSTCDSDFIYDNTEIEGTQNVALPNVENVTPLENLPVYNEDDIIISTESDTLASVIDAQEKQEEVKFDTSTPKSMLKKPVSKALAPDNRKRKLICTPLETRKKIVAVANEKEEYIKKKVDREKQLQRFAEEEHQKNIQHKDELHKMEIEFKKKLHELILRKSLLEIEIEEEKLKKLKYENKNLLD